MKPTYIEPLFKHVAKSLFPVLKKLFMEQNTAYMDEDAEKAYTVQWLTKVFDAMRGIEFEITYKETDGEGDPINGLASVDIIVGVADQAEMAFMLNIGDEVDLMELRSAIRQMFSIFEVAEDGNVTPFLNRVKKTEHLDKFMVMSGVIAYGQAPNDPEFGEEYLEEICEYEVKDLNGQPQSIRLII